MGENEDLDFDGLDSDKNKKYNLTDLDFGLPEYEKLYNLDFGLPEYEKLYIVENIGGKKSDDSGRSSLGTGTNYLDILKSLLPAEQTPDQKWVGDTVTGGRGILPKPGTPEDRDDYAVRGQPEEVRLQRALLKMDVRDGKSDISDLTAFDMKLMGIFESTPCPGFFSHRNKDGSEVGLGYRFKF